MAKPTTATMNRILPHHPPQYSNLQIIKRLLSSSPSTTSQIQKKSSYSSRILRIAIRAIKYLRIPGLVFMVYGLGYQKGVIDYARDPRHHDELNLRSTLERMNADIGDLKIAEDGRWNSHFADARLDRVAVVGHAILKVAKKMVEANFNKEMERCLNEIREGIDAGEVTVRDKHDVERVLEGDEDVEFWKVAKQRLDGAWRYVLIDSDIPNAFVSELLPNRIFVTTALFEDFVDNDDELALVLGHELSHVILGHGSEGNMLQLFLQTLEILLLSLDPTEGLVSLGVMSFLGFSKSIVGKAHSRDNERQADEMGIKFAAMACYDTLKASKVFSKFHVRDVEEGQSGDGTVTSLLSSHPPSQERYERLIELSAEENRHKYEDSSCASLKTRFKDMMHWRQKADVAVMSIGPKSN